MGKLFSADVVLVAVRDSVTRRIPLRVCKMDGSFDEPLSSDAQSTKRRCWTFVAKKSALSGTVPQKGDTISEKDGTQCAVCSVQPFYEDEYVIDARSL